MKPLPIPLVCPWPRSSIEPEKIESVAYWPDGNRDKFLAQEPTQATLTKLALSAASEAIKIGGDARELVMQHLNDVRSVWEISRDSDWSANHVEIECAFAAWNKSREALVPYGLVDAVDIEQKWATTVAVGPETATPIKNRRRHNTRKIDVNAALGKLESKMRKELLQKLCSRSDVQAALVARLYSLSAEDQAPMLKDVKCQTSAKTIRRSNKYKSWEPYRRPLPPTAPDLDCGPAALAAIKPHAADLVDDAVNSGQLSLRVGDRGTTHTANKTKAEKAREAEADLLAQQAGIELPPAE